VITGLEKAKEPLKGKVFRLSQTRKICAIYAERVRNSSSQATPNFHVGYRLMSGREDPQCNRWIDAYRQTHVTRSHSIKFTANARIALCKVQKRIHGN